MPEYRIGYRDAISRALDRAFKTLSENLEWHERIGSALDGEYSKESAMRFPGGVVKSGEELEDAHHQRRDSDIRDLGHIQMRLEEVNGLRKLFEVGAPIPPQEVTDRLYEMLRSCLIYEATRCCNKSSEELSEGVAPYGNALFFAFGIGPHHWEEFPFDLPSD